MLMSVCQSVCVMESPCAQPLVGGPAGAPWRVRTMGARRRREEDCWGGDSRGGQLQLQEVAAESGVLGEGGSCVSPRVSLGTGRTVSPQLYRFTEFKLRA